MRVPAGLQVTEAGHTLTPLTTTLPVAGGEYAFRVTGPDGAPLTAYTPTHERDLHLIVVRRDLVGFQHLHPTRDADGTWRVPLTPAAGAGSYRVYADFAPADRGEDDALTLGVDLAVAGDQIPVPLPAAAAVASVVDGYTVTLDGELRPGARSRVVLRVARDGRDVADLQPYLGAYGHLVALRAGDLAYLHVHPDGEPDDGRTAAGPEIAFDVEVPSAGDYRLYLDFRHGGVVRTAEFTVVAR